MPGFGPGYWLPAGDTSADVGDPPSVNVQSSRSSDLHLLHVLQRLGLAAVLLGLSDILPGAWDHAVPQLPSPRECECSCSAPGVSPR